MPHPLPPYGSLPQGDAEGCHLISENYAYALQFILGFAALAGLVFKRWRAPVKRDLVVWMYDVSKQGFGAMFIHVWNILLSIHEGGGIPGSDECAMYFVNFSLDIAIGTFMIWCFVRVQELTAVRCGIDSLKVTGDYGTPPLFSVYRTQLLAYTVILVICKAVTTAIVIAMDEVLSSLAKALFSPVSAYPELELTLVMIICPWILNALQFWILDNVLMSEKVMLDPRSGSFGKFRDDGDDALMPLVHYGSTSRYEHMADTSDGADRGRGGGGSGSLDASGQDASERDGLNTPTGLPAEPSWMSEPGGGGGGGGSWVERGAPRARGRWRGGGQNKIYGMITREMMTRFLGGGRSGSSVFFLGGTVGCHVMSVTFHGSGGNEGE